MTDIDDEVIQYFLEDPYYYNQASHFEIFALQNHLRKTIDFKNYSIEIYKELSDYLNLEKDSTLVKNVNEYRHYLGMYSQDSLHNVRLVLESDKTVAKITEKTDTIVLYSVRIFPESKEYFNFYEYLEH